MGAVVLYCRSSRSIPGLGPSLRVIERDGCLTRAAHRQIATADCRRAQPFRSRSAAMHGGSTLAKPEQSARRQNRMKARDGVMVESADFGSGFGCGSALGLGAVLGPAAKIGGAVAILQQHVHCAGQVRS